MKPLLCDHDGAKLKEKQNPKSGTFYQCPTCKCTYRIHMAVITNNQECWNKRINPKAKEKTKPKEKKPKRTQPTAT